MNTTIMGLLAEKTAKEWIRMDILWPNGNLHKHAVDNLVRIIGETNVEKLDGTDGWYITSDGNFNNPFSRLKDQPLSGNVFENPELKEVVFSGANAHINPHAPFYVGPDILIKEEEIPKKSNEYIAYDVMQFIKHVAQIGQIHSTLWYRGQSDGRYLPMPNIYRPGLFGELSETYQEHCDTHVAELERLQLEQFRAFGFPYIEYIPNNDQEWLVLMQHFGLKTRLLDFSIDPLVSLCFAVQLEQQKPGQIPCSNDEANGAVWLINPMNLNSIKHKKYNIPNFCSATDYSVLADEFRIGGKRVTNSGKNRKDPLAVVAALNNKRIVSQGGVFLLFPNLNGNSAFEDKCAMEDALFYKIIIPTDKKAKIREQLRGMGYNTTKIYPELSSVSHDISYRLATE